MQKEKSFLEKPLKKINEIEERFTYIRDLFFLAKKENDISLISDILKEVHCLDLKIKELEFLRMFSKKHDFLNCYLDFQSGSGGEEAQDWSRMLLRMYSKWIIKKNFQSKILEQSLGENNGVKSATVKVIGEYAFGWLRTESGIHRLVRKSPFDSNKKRHTSFCSVFIYPEIHDDINVSIKKNELRIDVYRASGAGGQHVNRTESAVRITHIPTGIVTQCQNARSQHKNKEQALKQLKSKIFHLLVKNKETRKKEIEKKKLKITWGNQIRSYVLDNSMIKDLRTKIESRNTEKVLNGDLNKFVKASLKSGL